MYLADTVVHDVAGNVVVVDLAALVCDHKEQVETRHDGVAHLDVVLQRENVPRTAITMQLMHCSANSASRFMNEMPYL